MKIYLLDSNLDLVEKIAQMPWYYLIIGSLIIIPVLLGSWIIVLNQMGGAFNDKIKKIFALALILLYITGIIILKKGNEKEAAYKVATNEIKAELNQRNWTMIGFKRIRQNFGKPEYTDNFLKKLADKSNGLFRTTVLGNDGYNDTTGLVMDTVQQRRK